MQHVNGDPEKLPVQRGFDQARLDYAVRLAGVGFWYCDLPFDELQWDARVKAHFWLGPDERVTIETFYERMHIDDREATRHAIDVSTAGGVTYDIEYRTVKPGTGEIKWIRALGGTTFAADGTPMRFDGVTLDITEKKATEEESKRLAARLQTILDTIPTGLIMLDERGAMVIENDEWKRTWAGNAMPDGVVDYDSYKGFVPETGRRISGEEWPCALSLKQGISTHDVVLDIERFNGARGTIVVSSSPLRNEGGKVIGAIAANMDITELRQAQARLQEADRRKDEFLAMLAHELRNPLAPIATATEILKRVEHDPARVRHTAEVIERQVQHLNTLVDDLLDVSRVTRGLVTIERTVVDLRSVASAALEQVQPLLESRRHEMRTIISPGDYFVEGDFHRLIQILANLLTNAAKYTAPGGRIVLRMTVAEGRSIIRVEDNGVGISSDMLETVFELFTQAERTPDRSQGGLGIGLSLVRSLVHLHGGLVTVTSEGAGMGSTFSVDLPLATRAMPGKRERTPEAPSSPGSRVLIVDDNRDAAQSLAELLSLMGHEVATAADGASALAAAQSTLWDVHVLDIGLPDMSGLDLVRRLKQGRLRPNAMFIALTGYGQPTDHVLSKEAGFDEHMVKPLDFGKLLRLLGERAT